MISEQIIQEAARRLADQFHPDQIILFGSYARGTADRHSDVDLLVITDDVKRKNRIKMMTEMASALDDLGFPKDIVIVTPDEFEVDKDIPGTISRYVSREGRLLYERKRQRRKKKKTTEWLRLADDDLRLARHAFKLKSAAPFKLISYRSKS